MRKRSDFKGDVYGPGFATQGDIKGETIGMHKLVMTLAKAV